MHKTHLWHLFKIQIPKHPHPILILGQCGAQESANCNKYPCWPEEMLKGPQLVLAVSALLLLGLLSLLLPCCHHHHLLHPLHLILPFSFFPSSSFFLKGISNRLPVVIFHYQASSTIISLEKMPLNLGEKYRVITQRKKINIYIQLPLSQLRGQSLG